ncbi:MAG: inositol monophosphatase [Actinomycetota bacterium]|nr:inositol monophosphatase [Actinomycetota bacterium]
MDDLDVAVAAARAGAKVVGAAFRNPVITEMKGTFDPVTEVDRAAEAAILAVLTELRPDDGVLGEEGTDTHGTGRRWLIDPLDGTVNFVHHIDQVAVSVALCAGERVLVGVVLDVVRDELFAAIAGGGATLDGSPISVSATLNLAGAVIATGFPYDHDRYAAAYLPTLGAVLAQVTGLRRFGSAALDMCWTAAGRFDGYYEYQVKPWDIAAGLLIVAESGGVTTDPWGVPLHPYLPHVVAANPTIHGPLRALVEGTVPAHLLG